MIRKAEISTSFLVGMILIILGAVILFGFFGFFNTSDISREVCHQSVILRATTPSTLGAQSAIPLKCETEKICISENGEKCEEDFKNDKDVRVTKVESSEEIEKVIAREMAEAWNILGEGKVSLFSQYFAKEYSLGTVYPTCVIYSRIAFDQSLVKKDLLTNIDMEKYLATHAVPNKEISYLDYFNGEVSVSDVSLSSEEVSEVKGVDLVDVGSIGSVLPVGLESKKELAIVFMQISSPDHLDVLKNTVNTALLGGVLAGNALGFVNLVKGVKSVGSVNAIAIAVVLGLAQQANVARNQFVTAGYCGDLELGSDAREGCSVIRLVDYDAETISSYCSVIEGLS